MDRLLAAASGRPIDALLANAGRGLGRAFIDQDFREVRRVIDTNVTGTVYLLQKVARDMKDRGHGRILITGSIAGFMPGTFQAVYNGTKAFLDSFSFALRAELKGSGVTVTCLMPGATETDFFERADMLDTKVGTAREGRSRRRCRGRLRRHDEGRGRRRVGLAEQAAGRHRQRPAGRHDGRAPPQAGGAGYGDQEVAQGADAGVEPCPQPRALRTGAGADGSFGRSDARAVLAPSRGIGRAGGE